MDAFALSDRRKSEQIRILPLVQKMNTGVGLSHYCIPALKSENSLIFVEWIYIKYFISFQRNKVLLYCICRLIKARESHYLKIKHIYQ